MSPDDQRLDPPWAKAQELGVPVLTHIGDPLSFLYAIGRLNEGYSALKGCPEWHFCGPEFPSFRELIEAGVRGIARHAGNFQRIAGAAPKALDIDLVKRELQRIAALVDGSGAPVNPARQVVGLLAV